LISFNNDTGDDGRAKRKGESIRKAGQGSTKRKELRSARRGGKKCRREIVEIGVREDGKNSTSSRKRRRKGIVGHWKQYVG